MKTEKEKIKIAHRNGKSMGYQLGREAGYAEAWNQLVDSFKRFAEGKKAVKPLKVVCGNCLGGLENSPSLLNNSNEKENTRKVSKRF